MPTWGWYVVGAGIFIVAYLYLTASKQGIGQIIQLPVVQDSRSSLRDVGNAYSGGLSQPAGCNGCFPQAPGGY
jgi:hypothetical protein